MAYQGGLLNKTLVIGILILFIGMSVVSSTDDIVEDVPDYHNHLESVYNSEKLFVDEKTAYAFIVHGGSSGYPNGPCDFPLDDPGSITSLTSYNNWMADDTWTCDGRWLACQYGSGVLFELNPETGDVSAIGRGGTNCNGLTWDPVFNRLYGTTGSELIEYNPDTGEQTVIGSHENMGPDNPCIAIAINLEGVCYGWDVKWSGNAILYTIDLETGYAEEVGDMGMNLIYA
jgi:hypothetical protein